MGFNSERALTVIPTSVARGLDGPQVTISSALARALLLVHRHEFTVYGGAKNLGPRSWSTGLVERTLGARAFAEPGMRVRRYAPIARESLDGAVYFREATEATVESLTKLDGPLPKGADELHVVVLRWEDALVPGEQLLVNGVAHVLEAVEPDEACWVRGPSLGGWQGTVARATPTLAQRVEARGIGPYSLITQRPLSPAGTISLAQLRHLAGRGCLAIVGEVTSLRSESIKLRTWGYESLVRRARIRDPLALLQPRATAFRDPDAESRPFVEAEEWSLTGALPTLQAAVAAAFACGFELSHAVPRLSLGFARIGTGSDWSRGRVLSADTVDPVSRRPIPGGLYCQRLFGPTQDDECACGKLRGKQARGTVCTACGVEVTRALVRRTRFAHLALSCLVVPAPYRSLVAQLLDEAPEVTEQRLVRDGGDAVLAQLEAIDLAQRVSTLGADHLLSRLHATGLSPADLLWSLLPVLPADVRPLVALGGGRYATDDLTERYRAIIEQDLALRGLLDVAAPAHLVEPARARLLRAVQGLFEGERPVDQRVKRPLGSLQGLLAWQVKPSAQRRVDYAASLVAVVDPSLRGSAAVVCEDALTEVLLPRLYGLLEQRGEVTNIKDAKRLIETDAERRRALTAEVAPSLAWLVMHADAKRAPTVLAVTPTPGHEPNVRLSPELAQRLDASTGDVLSVHLPVCDEAASEARWLERFPAGKFRAHEATAPRLLEALKQLESWEPVVDAALSGLSDDGSAFESGLLVGGFDLVRFPRPSENVW